MKNSNKDIVYVEGFSMEAGARLAQNLLKNHGIKSMFQASTVGGVILGSGSAAGPHALYVFKKDLVQAKEILALNKEQKNQ